MKQISIIVVLLILCGVCRSQTPVEIYPYKMNPRQHPDDVRHHVKTPDATLFDNKIQFIALRDLSGDYNAKLNQWVDKDRLGNILWVSYPLVFQDNLKEVVAEIKKRNLYLFDLWGYIPGSGPGGYWTQFQIPDGVLKQFETELGERWLGMDNGEQDGRYVGSFAPRMYPLGANRKQQYFNFQRHFEEMGNQLGNKMATLVSLNFGHYFLKEGVYTLIGAETAQGLPNSQIYYSFIRGAGKQYGVPWFGNASVWNRWGYKTYGKDATNIDDDYGSGGPLKGTSLSLLKRLMYNHILYNCVAVGFEGSMRNAEDQLSPVGKIQQSAVKWVDKYGDPGVMYTPVALMTDFFSGWSFPRHLYSGQAYKVWGNLPYEQGDYLTHGMLNLLYPGYQDASYYKDERGFIAPTPYGDMADCLLSDAPGWILQQYPLLVIADEIKPDRELNDKLNNYVNQGGHLVITSASLSNMKEGIAGVKTNGQTFTCSNPVQFGAVSVKEQAPFTLSGLTYPASASVIQRCGDIPAIVEMACGNGKVTVIASPFGVCETPQCPLPVTVREENPLPSPYPLLQHVQHYMAGLYETCQLFDTNKELSLVTCYRGNNEFTVLISNDGWEAKDFNLLAKNGKIVSIQELATDHSEQQAIGYTPKIVTTSFGKNTKDKIAGGDVRIFRVKIKDANLKIKPEITSVPNATGRALVLRNVQNLKEEILSRPTFFAHYDRVAIDWRYLHNRDKAALEEEAGWLNRQKLQVTVDLTSGLNLYPDLRIVNNDSVYYHKSMQTMKGIMDKMAIIGADELIVSSQRTIENNYTMEQFHASLRESFQVLADYAAGKNIRLVFRPSAGRVPEATSEVVKMVQDVNRPNFSFAPSLSLLLRDKARLDESLNILKAAKITTLILAAPQWDIHRQISNMNLPLYQYDDVESVDKILKAFPTARYLMDGLYVTPDEEYLDTKMIDNLLK